MLIIQHNKQINLLVTSKHHMEINSHLGNSHWCVDVHWRVLSWHSISPSVWSECENPLLSGEGYTWNTNKVHFHHISHEGMCINGCIPFPSFCFLINIPFRNWAEAVSGHGGENKTAELFWCPWRQGLLEMIWPNHDSWFMTWFMGAYLITWILIKALGVWATLTASMAASLAHCTMGQWKS